jgi:hypothetical protein
MNWWNGEAMNEKRIEEIKHIGAQNALNAYVTDALYAAKLEIEKAVVHPIIKNFAEHIPLAEKRIRDARKLLQHIDEEGDSDND